MYVVDIPIGQSHSSTDMDKNKVLRALERRAKGDSMAMIRHVDHRVDLKHFYSKTREIYDRNAFAYIHQDYEDFLKYGHKFTHYYLSKIVSKSEHDPKKHFTQCILTINKVHEALFIIFHSILFILRQGKCLFTF